MQGRHGGDDTRRAWKGPKEPPRHVGVDAIAAVSIVRPLRAAANATARGATGQSAVVHRIAASDPRRVIHRLSTVAGAASRPSAARSGRGATRGRIDGVTCPPKPSGRAGRRPAPPRSRRRCGRPATRPSVGLEGERLDLGLDDDVGEPRRAEQGEDRRRRSCSQRGSPVAARARRCGTRRPRRASPAVSQWSARGSSWMSRGEPRRPGAARPLEPQLGTAQRVGSAATRGPRSISVAAGLGQGEHRGAGRCRPSASAPAGRRDR